MRPNSAQEFPRFAQLRNYAHSRPLETKSGSAAKDKEELEILMSKYEQLEEDRDTWKGLALDEQAEKQISDAEVERLKAENIRLEQKSATLEYQLQNKGSISEVINKYSPLNSYDDLDEWAKSNLGKNIIIHPNALRDCRKNGHANMLQKIENVLLVIRDYIVPARMDGNSLNRELAREKLAELAMVDSHCFVDKEEAKRRSEYSVPYKDGTRVLFDHIKYGTGYDNSNQIRIYYFWDEDENIFVIGKMPTHLPNNRTT